ADISLVLSNRAEAYGLERAKAVGLPTIVIPHKDYPSREAFDDAMQEALTEAGIEFICLAGFMRILSHGFVDAWSGRMVNIHPSLLPAFKGHNAHAQVLASSVALSGCSVHAVTRDLDGGPIIGQAAVPRRAEDDETALAARVREAEHVLYPLAVKAFLREGDALPAFTAPPDMVLSLNSRVRVTA
ncbi:MAG: phosphoribosylglycinamide formyltransferase, partial [Pseudomonadota bacterium]